MIKGKEECFIAFPIIPYTEMHSLTALRLIQVHIEGQVKKKIGFFHIHLSFGYINLNVNRYESQKEKKENITYKQSVQCVRGDFSSCCFFLLVKYSLFLCHFGVFAIQPVICFLSLNWLTQSHIQIIFCMSTLLLPSNHATN